MSNYAMNMGFDSFKKASEVLYLQAGINGVGVPSNIDFVPAYIVNTCFCIEVGFKYLLEQQGFSPRGHKLRDLYNQLNQSNKDLIEKYIRQFSNDQTKYQQWFDDCLAEVNEGFVKWRYFYEATQTPTSSSNVVNSVTANLNFLKRLREALDSMI